MALSLGQYGRFLLVGGFVGVVTVACRELVGWALHADTQRTYSLSIAAAYTVGVVLSFLLNHRFTFGGPAGHRNWRSFARFVAVALTGLLSTWAFSLALRYGLQLDALIGRSAKLLAFATATVMSSLLTYPLNSWFVFGRLADSDRPT